MRRSALRRQAALAQPRPPEDIGLHSTVNRPYDPVAPDEASRILDAAIAYVAEVGVRFEPGTEADQIFAAAGCDVADGVVRIPAAVTRAALAGSARSVRLWDRAGTRHLDLDKDHTWFIPGMTCIRVYDWETGEPRDSTLADLARITRLADGLENIDAVCVACKDIPNSTPAGEIGEFLCLIENTSKPLEFLCEHDRTLHAAIEMAAALRGGHAALRAKPYFLHLVTPLPASYAATHVEQILTCVRAGVPVVSGTVAFGGASSPITVAGCVMHALATDFGAMVLGRRHRLDRAGDAGRAADLPDPPADGHPLVHRLRRAGEGPPVQSGCGLGAVDADDAGLFQPPGHLRLSGAERQRHDLFGPFADAGQRSGRPAADPVAWRPGQ
jgi:trimethylamine:corrinoid methyltransferase-like protein